MAGPIQQWCSFTTNNVVGYKSWAKFMSDSMATLGFVNCGASFTVDSATIASTTVTYNTTAPHTLLAGEYAWVTGMTNSTYNLSSVKITAVPTTTSFTVTLLAQVGTAASAQGGSVTTAPVRQLVKHHGSESPSYQNMQGECYSTEIPWSLGGRYRLCFWYFGGSQRRSCR